MTTKAIDRVIRNVPAHWVGDGFPVRSLFSYHEGAEFDPFLLLDYAGPFEFAPAAAPRGVGEHPHRGFETVTIVYEGELEHRDSAGAHGSIGAGDVQWMTAASGVVHEEFHSERFTKAGGILEMVQLWVNLPARLKMSAPRYQAILDRQIPRIALPNGAGEVRVIAGAFGETAGAAKTYTPINAWDLRFTAGGSVTLPTIEGFTTILVAQRGTITVAGGEKLGPADVALYERAGEGIEITASADARALVLCGQPLGEPIVAQGPFVMNTRGEIEQAIADFRSGKMGRLS